MQRRLNARSLVPVVVTNALASNLPNGDEVPVVSDLFVTLAVCTTQKGRGRRGKVLLLPNGDVA
jgi:hypothetical protein